MAESSLVNVVLEYLKSNKFAKTEAALRSEIGNQGDLNVFLQGLKLEEVMRKSGASDEALKEEFVVKEMEYGNGMNGSDSKWKNGEIIKISKNGAFVEEKNNSHETELDLYSTKFNSSNGSADFYQVPSQSKIHPSELSDTNKVTSKMKLETDSSALSKDDFMDNPWSRSDELKYSSSEVWKECSVKTVFPFPKGDVSTSYDTNYRVQGNNELKAVGGLGFPVFYEKQKEELPRLAPVKLKLEDKLSSITREEKHQRDGSGSKTDSSYLIGSFLDVPIGQEISSSGGKRLAGGNWFSVSEGITEDTYDLVSGFATIGDGLSDSVDYPNDYWDSDEYDDDDDVGYMRQPIEDETWFLAHEIDYPSDNEKKTVPQEKIPEKNEDDDLSFAEEVCINECYMGNRCV